MLSILDHLKSSVDSTQSTRNSTHLLENLYYAGIINEAIFTALETKLFQVIDQPLSLEQIQPTSEVRNFTKFCESRAASGAAVDLGCDIASRHS